jgi:hypothetical protein
LILPNQALTEHRICFPNTARIAYKANQNKSPRPTLYQSNIKRLN